MVEQADVPLCMVEVELQRCGAHVTRLLAAEFLAGPVADGATFWLLGRLYDGLIVPHAASFDVHDIAQAAGVPVVFDDDGASALNA